MTKRRPPISFQQAIVTIAGRVGYDAMADAVGKTPKAVRNWSDQDIGVLPAIEDARILDALYLEAGGNEPPILTVYTHLLGAAPVETAALAEAAARAAKEAGECVSALITASSPAATPSMRDAADHEAQEAIIAFENARQRLCIQKGGN